MNFILNSIERKYRASRLLSYPYQVTIDPTNICNLKCPLCPTWQDINARPKGKMSIQTFKKILDDIGRYLFTVNLCNWGEPFLNPNLPEMIEYAKRFNTIVGLSTNLNNLPDDSAENTIKAGVDIIVISLDGVYQETYSKYRQNGDIQKVFANIEKLNYYKKNSHKPLLIWQFLVNKYNETELDTAKKTAKKMGMLFQPSPLRSSMGKELILPLYERVQEIKDWLPKNAEYRKYPQDLAPGTKTNQSSCKWLWNSTVINWDGSVSPCCAVFEKKWDFGSALDNGKSSFRKSWNSPKYILARKLVSAYFKKSTNISQLIKQAKDKDIICANCIRYGFLED